MHKTTKSSPTVKVWYCFSGSLINVKCLTCIFYASITTQMIQWGQTPEKMKVKKICPSSLTYCRVCKEKAASTKTFFFLTKVWNVSSKKQMHVPLISPRWKKGEKPAHCCIWPLCVLSERSDKNFWQWKCAAFWSKEHLYKSHQ